MQIAKSNGFLISEINNIVIQCWSEIFSFKAVFSNPNKVISEKTYEHNTFRANCFLSLPRKICNLVCTIVRASYTFWPIECKAKIVFFDLSYSCFYSAFSSKLHIEENET